jgi:hypothetical protein
MWNRQKSDGQLLHEIAKMNPQAKARFQKLSTFYGSLTKLKVDTITGYTDMMVNG